MFSLTLTEPDAENINDCLGGSEGSRGWVGSVFLYVDQTPVSPQGPGAWMGPRVFKESRIFNVKAVKQNILVQDPRI